MAIFHYTIKIVGRSKGKSVISASAYLNGDVMKNEETGRISYYTSKKEVVYTSLMTVSYTHLGYPSTVCYHGFIGTVPPLSLA